MYESSPSNRQKGTNDKQAFAFTASLNTDKEGISQSAVSASPGVTTSNLVNKD
jgi:hypothetical protein